MQVKILTEARAAETLQLLIRDCVSFDVAVAWATDNTVVNAMLTAHDKLGFAVIGTHMYQTDPRVLRAFMPYAQVRCTLPNGRLFHPKVYLFRTLKGLSAVVGSHNLTHGAFGGNNIEVSVLVEGSASDEVFGSLASFIESCWKSAAVIKEDDFLFSYEIQYKANKGRRAALTEFHWLARTKGGAKTSPLLLSWEKFVKSVKNDRRHSLQSRLAILERAGSLFAEHQLFSKMPPGARKAIAGTYGKAEAQLDNLEWPWFGNMFGQGDFKNLVNESPERLSAALDHIPLEGDISESHFDAFAQEFDLAFAGKAHKGGVATATRLLALKRPDFFIGVNTANRNGICAAFGTAPTTLNLANYWERVVIPMTNSPWWLAPRPRESLNSRIWDNRAALLDILYFPPPA